MSSPGRESHEPYPLREPDTSLGELFGRLTNEFGELVRTHIELAKVEVKDEAKDAGKGTALLVGGAVAALLALAFLSSAAAWALDNVMPDGVAFLIVGLIWVVMALVLASAGRQTLKKTEMPQGTVQELKEDRRWMSEQR